MKKLKKIINYTLTVVTVLLFILTFIVLIKGIKANKEGKIAQVFGYSYSVVPTPSMVPTINIGDVVISKDVDFSTIQEEDIIVFYSPLNDKYIVHRVKKINEDGTFTTKGDANGDFDSEHVTPENFVGRVVLIIPNIGNLVLKYRSVIFITVIGIFFIIIVSEVIKIIKNVNEMNKEKHEQELEEKRKIEVDKIKKELENSENTTND